MKYGASRLTCVVVAIAAVVSCAPPPGAASEPQLRMLDSAQVTPCTDSAAIAAARASGAIKPPTLMKMLLPPVPVPASIRGKRIDLRIRVDSIGRPDTAATVIAGIPPWDPYARSIRRGVSVMTFYPALMPPSYCSVSAMFALRMDLSP